MRGLYPCGSVRDEMILLRGKFWIQDYGNVISLLLVSVLWCGRDGIK